MITYRNSNSNVLAFAQPLKKKRILESYLSLITKYDIYATIYIHTAPNTVRQLVHYLQLFYFITYNIELNSGF